MVYAPVFDTLWFGYMEEDNGIKKAFKTIDASQKIRRFDIAEQKLLTRKPLENVKVITSRFYSSRIIGNWLKKNLGIKKYIHLTRGSSLKFCLISEGLAHLYPRQGVTCIWDTVASHAILNCSGGSVISLTNGSDLVYNQNLENPEFLASCWNTREISLLIKNQKKYLSTDF